jgi:hypothetical protein
MKYNTPNFLTALDLDEVTKEGFSYLYCEDGESMFHIYIYVSYTYPLSMALVRNHSFLDVGEE